MKHLLKQKQANKVGQILQALINWNADAILPLLDKNRTYQDLSPKDFIATVKLEYRAFKRSRDTKLILGTDLCKGCNCKEPIFVLKGNNSGREYALYFQFEYEEIVDIYQCNYYGKISFDEITFEGKDNLKVTFL
ncbi:hypothetical protein [Aestuariivivens sediminis]|uniref:hypothetical protein n=1 Tax=Aestuariivivens sediminis TaxID=2913557 RepID=UPI001F574FE6|nr:hypothetical protein [Aestuariivivens sediminis]